MNKKTIIIVIAIIAAITVVSILYYSQNFGKKVSLVAKDESLEEVLNRDRLIIAVFPEFNPMVFKDENDKEIGMDIDFIREIAAEIGVSNIEIKPMPFKEIFVAIQNDEVDLAISGITITPERSEKFLFTIPYFNNGQNIVVQADNSSIKNPKDLAGKKIGVIPASTCEQEAKKYSDKVIGYTNREEVAALKKGDIDATIIDNINALILVKENKDLKVAMEKPFSEEYYGIMTKKNSNALVARLDQIIRDMRSDGRLAKIQSKWLPQ